MSVSVSNDYEGRVVAKEPIYSRRQLVMDEQ